MIRNLRAVFGIHLHLSIVTAILFTALPALGQAEFRLTKSGPSQADPGELIAYSIVLQNSGDARATDIALTDPLPAGTTFTSISAPGEWLCSTPAVGQPGTITCLLQKLEPDEVVTLTIGATINPSQPGGTTLVNTAEVMSEGPEPRTATATTTVGTTDLSILKTGDATTSAGGTIQYQITITNEGDAASAATLTDVIPDDTVFASLSSPAGWTCSTPPTGSAGTVACNITSIAPGASAVFTLTVTASASAPAGSVFMNTARVSAPAADDDPANDTSTATTAIPGTTDLQIGKSGSTTVRPGGSLSYSIAVANTGAGDLTNVTIDDTLPVGVFFQSLAAAVEWSCSTPAVGANGTITCSRATLPAGASSIISIGATTDPALTPGTVLSNTATANADGLSGPSSDSHDTTVAGTVTLSVTASDTPDPVAPGGAITYAIDVSNESVTAAQDVEMMFEAAPSTTFVSATAPPGWTCSTPPVGATNALVTCSTPSLASGAATITIETGVPAAAADGSTLSAHASVTTSSADADSDDDEATATTTVQTAADVTIAKSGPATANAGEVIAYTLTAGNAGPSDASSVVLTDILPAGLLFESLVVPAGWSCTAPPTGTAGTITCDSTLLVVGGTAVFTVSVRVPQSATGTTQTNAAHIESDAPDLLPGNDDDEVDTLIGSSADLRVTKTGPATAAPGDTIAYTIAVANDGPSDAINVTVSDPVPAGTTFVLMTAPGGWTCSGGNFPCSIATLPAGASASFTLQTAISAAAQPGTSITNTAKATSDTTDPDAVNNTSSVTTAVASPATLSATKSIASGLGAPGSNVTYSVVISNSGPETQFDNPTGEMTDQLPAELQLVSATATSGTTVATIATNLVTWNGAIASGGSVTVTIDAMVVSGGATNQAVVHYDADGNGTNESTASSNVVAFGASDLSITKTAPASIAPGQTLAYTIVVTNEGPSAASSLVMSDTISLPFVSITEPAGWTCTTPAAGSTGPVSCTAPALAAAATATFDLRVSVPAGTPLTTSLTNTATISSALFDPDSTDNTSTATTTVASPATLSATKSIASGLGAPGSNVTYSVVISNSGPETQFDNPTDEMTDQLPAELQLVSATATSGTTVATIGTNLVTWNGAIPPGGSVTVTIDALVVSGGANNQAVVHYDADGNGTNESTASSNVVAFGASDLTVTKTAPGSVIRGDDLVYTVSVTNNGPDPASTVTLTDTLTTPFASLGRPAGWTCTTPAVGSTGTITCTTPALASGATATFALAVSTADQSPGTSLQNTASVTSAMFDPNAANSAATAAATVTSPASVAIDKRVVTGSGSPGTDVTFAIVLTNSGPGTQLDNAGDEMVDTLPAELDLLSASATSGTVAVDLIANRVTWNGEIAPGTSVTINVIARLLSAPATNSATMNFDSDGDGTNESAATATVTVAPAAAAIPVLSPAMIAGLALMLGLLAMRALRS